MGAHVSAPFILELYKTRIVLIALIINSDDLTYIL